MKIRVAVADNGTTTWTPTCFFSNIEAEAEAVDSVCTSVTVRGCNPNKAHNEFNTTFFAW